MVPTTKKYLNLYIALCIIVLCILFAVTRGYSQPTVAKPERYFYLQETKIVPSGKINWRITTFHDTIVSVVTKSLGFNIIRIIVVPKKDRMGDYWLYDVYFKPEYLLQVENVLKEHNIEYIKSNANDTGTTK